MLFGGMGGTSPRDSASVVAPAGQRPDQRLRDVLDRREPADRVAVDGRVAHRQLALVPGGEHEVALGVGQGHQGRTPDARLQVLLGEAGECQRPPGRRRTSARSARCGWTARCGQRGRRRRRPSDRRSTCSAWRRRRRAPARTRRRRWRRRAPSRSRRSGRAGPSGSRSSRRSRAAPSPAPGRPRRGRRARGLADAAIEAGSAMSMSTHSRAGSNCGARASSVPSGGDDEGVAVEDQLVLPADHVDVDEGRAGLRGPRAGTGRGGRRPCRARRARR